MSYVTRICSFEAVDFKPPSRGPVDYTAFRRVVLAAGRFSVFEATETAAKARLFTQLAADPTVRLDTSCGFPWTRVAAR